MVRYYRRQRRRFTPKYSMRRRTMTPRYKRKGMKGNKFRLRMKSKKWNKFTFFDIIKPALNTLNTYLDSVVTGNPLIRYQPVPAVLPAGGQVQAHDPDARTAWFGNAYAAGAGGAVDVFGNPTTVGDGLLWPLSTKDDSMVAQRWDYSAYGLTQQEIIDKWNANNNVAGAALQIPASSIFVKGVKINAQGRNVQMPTLCYMGYNKGGMYKTREQIGRIKGYFATKKETNGVNIGGVNYRWSIPRVDVGATVYTRIKVTVYYKIKNLVY